jgi:hypothetical protein
VPLVFTFVCCFLVCRSSGGKEPTAAVDFGVFLLASCLALGLFEVLPTQGFLWACDFWPRTALVFPGQILILTYSTDFRADFFLLEQRFVCPVLIFILILFEVLLFVGQISSCNDWCCSCGRSRHGAGSLLLISSGV